MSITWEPLWFTVDINYRLKLGRPQVCLLIQFLHQPATTVWSCVLGILTISWNKGASSASHSISEVLAQTCYRYLLECQEVTSKDFISHSVALALDGLGQLNYILRCEKVKWWHCVSVCLQLVFNNMFFHLNAMWRFLSQTKTGFPDVLRKSEAGRWGMCLVTREKTRATMAQVSGTKDP